MGYGLHREGPPVHPEGGFNYPHGSLKVLSLRRLQNIVSLIKVLKLSHTSKLGDMPIQRA